MSGQLESQNSRIEDEIQSSENQKAEVIVDFDDIKNLKFNSTEKTIKEAQKWAYEKGFEIVQLTSPKEYAIYLQCKLSGKPRIYPGSEKTRNTQ